MKPIDIPTFQPRMKVLNREQALAIHTAALEILENTGFKMEHDGALEMLVGAGCRITDDDRVKMSANVVEEALK
ncbi:MAG: trimethylamine methyltransferase family protein, partial [Dehalococcoidia bacterium]